MQNAFGENNREMIGKVLRAAKADSEESYASTAAAQDFIVFLENVVRVDCEIEDEEDEEPGKRKQPKTAKDRAAFFAAKYAGVGADGKTTVTDVKSVMQNANRFSLSRIEWLENIYTND